MRKRPPAGLEQFNSGEPWSAMDLADLEDFVTEGASVERMAEYLCRTVDEVERKIASLSKQKGATYSIRPQTCG